MDNNAQLAEVKQSLKQSVMDGEIDPSTMIRLGEMAKAVLKDKSAYPQFIQAVVDSGLADEADFSGGIDYQIVGVFVATGEMIKQMIASGELRG